MNPEGEEFWLCFMQNYKADEADKNALMLELFITSETDTKVTIEIKALNYYKTLKLDGKTVQNVKLPYLAEIKSSEVNRTRNVCAYCCRKSNFCLRAEPPLSTTDT